MRMNPAEMAESLFASVLTAKLPSLLTKGLEIFKGNTTVSEEREERFFIEFVFGLISLIFIISHGAYQKKFPNRDAYGNEFDRLLRNYIVPVFGEDLLENMVTLFYARHDSYSATFRLKNPLDPFAQLLEFHLDAVLSNIPVDFSFSPDTLKDLSPPHSDFQRKLFCGMVVGNEMKAALEWLNDLEMVE